jgi:hypothetical protein
MKITIAERFHPFSHRPGTVCPLPLSTWQATIYPTRIILSKIDAPSHSFILDLALQGPVKEFTVELELEKGIIRVFGFMGKKSIRYEIRRHTDGILFTFEKIPTPSLQCNLLGKALSYQLVEKEPLLIPVPPEMTTVTIPTTRLSLGMHKAQDWEMVLRRFDLREILPILMRLGATIPSTATVQQPSGTLQLLHAFESACAARNKLEATASCEQWLRTSFTGILVPTLNDTLFQGILPSSAPVSENTSVLPHLIEGSRLVRSLFFEETQGPCEKTQWEILPCLLPAFAAGRLLNLSTQHLDTLSIEWSKHQLKKMIIHTSQQRLQSLKFPKEIRSFRLRTSLKEKGKVYHLEGGCIELPLPAHTQLFLDCFKK